MMRRIICISDIHGCLEELDELLRLVSYTPNDRLVFAGDLVDRGPDSVGVVRRVRELNALSVMGNHDEWYIRCARHEANEKLTGKPNPLKNRPKFELYKQFSAEDLDWMAKMPYYHYLDPKTVVVHAGLAPNVPIDKQKRGHLLRMRYLKRSNGEMWDMSSDKLLTPDVATYWTEVWAGPENVIYGHHPSKTDTIVTENGGATCWGIDTGACFGNKLSAWVRTDKIELVSVPAKAAYADWHISAKEKD